MRTDPSLGYLPVPMPAGQEKNNAQRKLLAVDLGLHAGLAVFGDDGRLYSYRSQHFATRDKLRRAVPAILRGIQGLALLVLEGDRSLGEIWQRAALHDGIAVTEVPAEVWRRDLLLPREQRNGVEAKAYADDMARRVIAWSKAPAVKALKSDAAEAILIGLWGVLQTGWLAAIPAAVRQR